MVSIALPKGRLGNKAYGILQKCGYTVGELADDSRKLVFENEESGVRYFLVKPSDVAIYVEYGAADIGVVGKRRGRLRAARPRHRQVPYVRRGERGLCGRYGQGDGGRHQIPARRARLFYGHQP